LHGEETRFLPRSPAADDLPRDDQLPVWRYIALVVSLVLGAALSVWIVNGHYPIQHWLFWIYARCFLLCGWLALACVSVGQLALLRGLRLFFPLREHFFFAFALGLLIFGLGIAGLGFCHLLTPAVFWLWPVSCVAVGGPSLWRFSRRLRRHLGYLRARPRAKRLRASTVAVIAFGAIGVLLLYANIMTPWNVGYDAYWYHFSLAEHYVAAGAITRFPEGFFSAAWPHFASWLYTWAFLSPGSLAWHMELAEHVEFLLFVATLAGLPILVRWMLHGRRAPHSWSALFLFPGILLYDSSLWGGADHVLAFWALGTLLALRRAWRTFASPPCLLFACMAAGAALTKYQSVNPLAFPALAFLASAVWAIWRSLRRGTEPSARKVTVSVGLTALAFWLLWSPHWLKNALWYGDPFYPVLRQILPDRPWARGAVTGFPATDWRPSGPFGASFVDSLEALFNFSFKPHDWPEFHGMWPVFGSLFTLLLVPLAWLRRTSRTWMVSAAALTGVFVWYWTFHQDRYLQALLPFMVAVVAVVLIRLWQAGTTIRLAAAGLVGMQIIWGGDVYFFPTHSMFGDAPIQATIELMSSGFRGAWQDRFNGISRYEPLAPLLPIGSVALIHESEKRLGTGTRVVTDARAAQAGINYAALGTPRAIWDLLRSFGVTHLIWQPGSLRSQQRLADEVAFLNFSVYAEQMTSEGAVKLARMPRAPPPNRAPVVGMDVCGHKTGIAPHGLDSTDENPRAVVSVATAPESPDVWLIDEECDHDRSATTPPAPPAGYRTAGRFAPFLIAIREYASSPDPS
jgi:hypothetical protein